MQSHNPASRLHGMQAAAYLRKSRMEEGMETQEVLSRHQAALQQYAEKTGIHIVETFHEVLSGESLYARPEMLRLLEQVEAGRFDAVLVVDLDRLSRGRMKDQGIILDAFRDAETLIVTPEKTYDLHDEIDDELAEFKTFMSRREYKIINKRLRRGLQQSIEGGCYVANPPYGYRRLFLDKRPTLEICEEEAVFVRMMFALYLQGQGCTSIAREVNLLGARPHRADRFSRNSVAIILRNPVYIGKLAWNQKKHIKKGAKGNDKHITIYNPREQWTIVQGLHPPIISEADYSKVQQIMSGRYTPSKKDGTVKSALAGLLRCHVCGRNMQRMTMKGTPYLLCVQPGCCASVKFAFAEAAVLAHLEEALARIRFRQARPPGMDTGAWESRLAAAQRELSAVQGQKARLYELLELGAYDLPLFRARMALVAEKLSALEARMDELRGRIDAAERTDRAAQAEKITSVLAAYGEAGAAERNALLHSVIDYGVYRKEKKSRPREFSIELYLKPF